MLGQLKINTALWRWREISCCWDPHARGPPQTVQCVQQTTLWQIRSKPGLCYCSTRPSDQGGDFNAHLPMLDPRRRLNAAGIHIADVLDTFREIALLNTQELTHVKGGFLNFVIATIGERIRFFGVRWNRYKWLLWYSHYTPECWLSKDQSSFPNGKQTRPASKPSTRVWPTVLEAVNPHTVKM